MPIASVNPATGRLVQSFDSLTAQQTGERLTAAELAFPAWRGTSFPERSVLMTRAAEILEERSAQYGRMITLEMGKPLKAAIAEVEKCAKVCRYYAEHAAAYLADEHIQTDAAESFIRYQPLGLILAVMPWNFPFWQVFRFAAPTLMAGNVGLLKHASNVPQCALAIEAVFHDAGFPAGVFQSLLIGSKEVESVIEDERVRAVTLTGSEPAGSSVAGTAARKIKKSVLELGGSDPFVVMPSADLSEAVRTGVLARIVNNGQSCIAAKRFIVHQDVADEFEDRFVDAMKKLRVGDPMSDQTEVGPMALEQIATDLEEQVRGSVSAGARLLLGGSRIDRDGGYYFEPTVLTDIPRDAPVFAEETFGPVASLFRVADVEEAIALANATPFGLGASVWTGDRKEAEQLIDGIESGQVFVNAMVASDPRMPFGGVKHSGFGRELGVLGIREFVNIKTVWVMEGAAGKSSLTE